MAPSLSILVARFRRASRAARLSAFLFAGIGVVLLGWSLLCCFAEHPDTRFDEHAFAKLYVGMTESQVSRALKCPPGDYRSEDLKERPWGAVDREQEYYQQVSPNKHSVKVWLGDRGAVLVVFDEKAKLIRSRFFDGAPLPILQRLRTVLCMN